MALTQVDLICPHCKENGELWVSPRDCYRVECRECGKKWEHNELNEICTMLIKKAESDRSFKHWTDCLRIQMQHMIDPYTGKCYVTT